MSTSPYDNTTTTTEDPSYPDGSVQAAAPAYNGANSPETYGAQPGAVEYKQRPWHKMQWVGLGLNLVSLLVFGFLSIAGIIIGIIGLKPTDKRTGTFKGHGLAITNIVLGVVCFALWVVAFITILQN